MLGVDTCGAVGSIALGRVGEDGIALVGERVLAGGEFAAGLVPAFADLLGGIGVGSLVGIVAVAGPGSFTGIRVGLAAVKGLAEAADLPVLQISRLELLAEIAAARCSVLDAHRGQFYCGFYEEGEAAREMLLTAGEINAMGGLTGRVAVCEETVAQALEELCGEPEIVRVPGPTAWDALRFSAVKWRAGEFADVVALDGYYLRGADAKLSSKAS